MDTNCLPLILKTVSSFSGPNSALPISLNLIVPVASSLIINSSKSETVLSLPTVLTANSELLPTILPEGNSTFSLSSACFTSKGVNL